MCFFAGKIHFVIPIAKIDLKKIASFCVNSLVTLKPKKDLNIEAFIP